MIPTVYYIFSADDRPNVDVVGILDLVFPTLLTMTCFISVLEISDTRQSQRTGDFEVVVGGTCTSSLFTLDGTNNNGHYALLLLYYTIVNGIFGVSDSLPHLLR